MANNPQADLLDEIIDYLAAGLLMTPGVNLFNGELIESDAEGLYLVEMAGPGPDLYLDTEHRIIDLWSRSPTSNTAKANLRRAYDILERKGNYALTNWYIYFSYASGTMNDEGRDAEGGKLYRQTYTVICRNMNNIS